MPQISVIISVYNTEPYLEACLNSVVDQTFSDIEIICINDGSTDNSAAILSQYAQKDSRIKIINQNNTGVVIARNNAIKQAQSNILYILDSDDIIDKTTLEKSYNALISGKGDIITCRVLTFGIKNQEMFLPSPTKLNMAFGNCLINAALFKKSLFNQSGGFDQLFKNGLEDYDLWLNMIYRQNAKIYRIPEVLFFYRLKPISESRNMQQKKIYFQKLTDLLNSKYPEMKKYRLLAKFIRLFFQTKHTHNKTIIKLFKIPIFEIKSTAQKQIFYLFGFIPIFYQQISIPKINNL